MKEMTDMTKRMLERLINRFREENSEIRGLILTTQDGFVVTASHQEDDEYARRLAAMSSSAQAIGQAMLRELGAKDYKRTVLESSDRVVLLLSVPLAASMLVLMSVSTKDAALGQQLWKLERLVTSLTQLTAEGFES